jgi:fructuronate reductase
MGTSNVQTAHFGIVHFGIGAFHRAHQAWYTDKAQDRMQDGASWSIVGISLRSATVAQLLNPQDGLYTVTECSAEGRTVRVIGSVRQVLIASEQPEAVVAAIAAPETRIISFTVTEKGYCRTADGALDPELAHGGSIYAFLSRGLRRRIDAGLPGLTLLSCDNLAHNGRQLENLLAAYLRKQDPELAEWAERNCTFPCSMVDRIVPATTAADLEAVTAAIGMEDQGTVVTEPFSQWVIENRFAGQRPAWETVGAEIVTDVSPYETAKLRLLNGAHSALAYLGLEQGHTFVHEAVADPAIRPVIERLMRDEAAPTIAAAPGQDLGAYADALLHRFANPALNHRLIQIAMDGSQKITQRWLETLMESRDRCPAILTALASWLRHVRGDNAAKWGAVDDPMAEALALAWKGRPPAEAMNAILGKDGVISSKGALKPSDARELLALINVKQV